MYFQSLITGSKYAINCLNFNRNLLFYLTAYFLKEEKLMRSTDTKSLFLPRLVLHALPTTSYPPHIMTGTIVLLSPDVQYLLPDVYYAVM